MSEVFRIKYPNVPFSVVKMITSSVPDESKIEDQLQVIRDNGGNASAILWSLNNKRKALEEYCYVDDDGTLQGEYKIAFEQAIRLEGTRRIQSKHASGLAIASVPISEIAPTVYDKSSSNPIAGFEMDDLSDAGAPKLDILGTVVLDKFKGVQNLLRYGRMDVNV